MSAVNVVIIDDDEITLTLLEHIVEDLTTGYILVFANSTKAKAFLQSEAAASIGLVICDWQMPDISGIDILQTLRDKNLSCPFFMVTANPTKELLMNAKRLGVTDFIAKPFSSDDLAKKISLVLANSAK